MCLKESDLTIVNNILIIVAVFMPLIYLIIKKRKKIGHYLIAILLLAGILFIKWGVNFMKCKDAAVVDNEPKKQDEIKLNPNYVDTTSKGYIIEKIDGAYYIDNYLVVNKTYRLDSDFVPKNTYAEVGNKEICSNCIDETAYDKWLEMKNDASAIGLNIYIASGYRSFDYQDGLYNRYVARDGKDAADTYSARSGHSEHQSGLAFDLNEVSSSFAATNEGKWVSENAYLYGFIIRYPKDKSDITGYKYEPWHLRYVGLDLANKLYNKGSWITMEEYFGIDSKYK